MFDLLNRHPLGIDLQPGTISTFSYLPDLYCPPPLRAYLYGVLGVITVVLFEFWLIRKARLSIENQRETDDERPTVNHAAVSDWGRTPRTRRQESSTEVSAPFW